MELAEKKSDDNPKTRGFRLIPRKALFALAAHYLKGAERHGENNWKKGRVWSDYYDAIQRHMTEWWDGDSKDEEGNYHLIAVAWNALALFTFEEIHPELDDRKSEFQQFIPAYEAMKNPEFSRAYPEYDEEALCVKRSR